MYDDWSSLSIQLGPSGTPSLSVLSKLPPDEAKRVVSSVVKTVASQVLTFTILLSSSLTIWSNKLECFRLVYYFRIR